MILRKYGKKEGGGNIIDVGSARKRVCTISIINGSRFHFWESKEREQAAKKIAIESVAVWTLTCAHLPEEKRQFAFFGRRKSKKKVSGGALPSLEMFLCGLSHFPSFTWMENGESPFCVP